MKKKPGVHKLERSHQGRGISMPVEVWEQIDNHIAEAYPRFASVSHFLQVCVAAHMQSAKAANDETKSSPKRQG